MAITAALSIATTIAGIPLFHSCSTGSQNSFKSSLVFWNSQYLYRTVHIPYPLNGNLRRTPHTHHDKPVALLQTCGTVPFDETPVVNQLCNAPGWITTPSSFSTYRKKLYLSSIPSVGFRASQSQGCFLNGSILATM